MQQKESGLMRLRKLLIQTYVFIKWSLRMAVIWGPGLLGFYWIWDSYFPPEDSEFVKRLKQIDNYGLIYAHEIIEEDWDVICQLRYCREIMSDYFAKKYSDLNGKIPALELCSDTSWSIVFSKHDRISHITTNRRTSLDGKGDNFTEESLKKFAEVGFKPQECAEFKDAVFFKYPGDSSYSGHMDVRTFITLGELKK